MHKDAVDALWTTEMEKSTKDREEKERMPGRFARGARAKERNVKIKLKVIPPPAAIRF